MTFLTCWLLRARESAWELLALIPADHIRRKLGAKIGIGARMTEVQTHLRELFGAPEAETEASAFDALFEDGEIFGIVGVEARALYTPGHTLPCGTHVIGDAAFVDDTLFMPDYRTTRADFPGSDAETLYRSIRKILAAVPETYIFIGRDYLRGGAGQHGKPRSRRSTRLTSMCMNV